MPRDLVSPRTRQEFREYFVSTTLATIGDAFSAEGLEPDQSYSLPVGGQRRTLVEQYYRHIDWRNSGQVARALRVFEAVLIELDLQARTEGANSGWARDKGTALRQWLARDGITEVSGRLTLPGHASLHDALTSVDAPELQRQIDRMRSSVDSDPGLAIGTAKELVETVSKTILSERGVEIDPNWDLPRLVKEARACLSLLPADINEASRGAESIRRVLSNLGSLVAGIAELRSLYGTGHGRHGQARGPHPRHARLVVGAAATLATFLLETHEERE